MRSRTLRLGLSLLATVALARAAQAVSGTATVVPSTATEGTTLNVATITYIVPAGGLSGGGGLQIQLPFGWSPYPQTTSPANYGYVTAQSAPSQTLVLISSTTNASIEVILSSAQVLAAGSTIQVVISNLWVGCPSPGQSAMYWGVSERTSFAGTYTSIAAPIFTNTVVGNARYLGFQPWDVMTAVRGQSSSALTVIGQSGCGHAAPVSGNVTLALSGILSDYASADTNAQFSSSPTFTTSITSVTILSGASQASFYYKTTSTGNNLSVRASYNDLVGAFPTYISRPVNVLANAVTFSGLSLDAGTSGSGGSTFTLTPDNDGVNDSVFIRFTPSDASVNWRVRISSDGFNSWVYERWGYGDPTGSLQWDGRNNSGGYATNNFVPNGTYQVRVEAPGLTPDTSLSITVSAASISGRLLLGSSGVAGAWVNANATSGGGYGGAITDSSGTFVINGLRSGQNYNLYTYFYDPATGVSMNGSRLNVSAPATGANITLAQPASIRVAAILNQAPTIPLYGNVWAHTSDYAQSYNSSIRVQSGSTTSDNGDSFNPSSWTVLVAQPGSYTVQLNLPGFNPIEQSVTVAAGQTVDVPVFNLTRPANVYGLITLPAALSNAAWISVEGIRSGTTYPTSWGGVYFNVGQSTGVFQIFNVSTGTYSFRARVPGYVPVAVSTTVGTSDIGDYLNGGLNISSTAFSTGGKISGTITIQGDTSGQTSPMTLWINAYSPSLGSSEFTQVQLATSATSTSGSYQIGGLANGTYQVFPPYLSGFDLNPPGPKSVTVSGGNGALNLLIQQNTGAITGALTLPSGHTDFSQVSIFVTGPNTTQTIAATGATYTIPHLASGYYDVTASYGTSGAQSRMSVAVVNGRTTTQNIDLSAPTFTASGTVSIGSAFTISPSTGATITINTIGDMLANSATQYVSINGSPQSLSTARIEAFPKRFDSYGNANRSGFTNTFFGADYKWGTIQGDGTYSIAGLSPGVWELNVYPFLDGGQQPSLAAAKQTLTVSAANATNVNFSVSAGYSVGGTISFAGGATDTRTFNAVLQTERGDYVQSSQMAIGAAGTPAASTTYLFKNLTNGRYVLIIQDPGTWDSSLGQMVRKYAVKPIAFEISAANITGLNITITRASRILGKLSIRGKNADGSASSTLVTSNNTTLLPDNLRIAAVANPWVEGGYQEAATSSGGGGAVTSNRIDVDSNNQFHIDGLVAGTYDVQFRQDTYSANALGQGSANLASYTQAQVKVTEGQATDIGTIELKQGLSVTGTVTDSAGNALSNIRVRAETSGNHNGNNSVETLTDSAGQFTLSGLSPDLKTYDITAAPRPGISDITPPSAYGQVVKKAVDITQNPPPTLSFALQTANASLSGRVLTVDGGPLAFPDGDKEQGYPAAAIYLQARGVPTSADNPLGDIHEATNLDGTFTVRSLVPGTYDGQIISLNYKPVKFSATVTAGANTLANVTLQKGAGLTATLVKPDGSGVNTTDVDFAVAATADLGSIIFGQITSDDNTKTIRSIRFSGFDSTKRYSILLFDKRDNIVTPVEGRSLSFTNDQEEKTLALTFQPSAPTAFTHVRKVGDAAEITYFFSRTLRNLVPADNDFNSLMTIVSGGGVLSGGVMSGDRQSLTILYTPPADEQTATIRLSGYTADIDPTTGSVFPISKSIVLRFGQRATAEKNISPVLGGQVSLAEAANDPSGVSVPANALLTSTGAYADTTQNYAISFTATDDATASAFVKGSRTLALTAQTARGSGAYIPEAYHAMTTARASSTINPFSSFYSVLLPAGLSHTLNQNATLTLQYDSSADPTKINVYYFNGTRYLLENSNRTIDTVNRTIAVNVSHFSTFVVLENSASVVTLEGGSGSEPDITVFNFPNPFDLKPKTMTLNRGQSASDTMPTDGTVIRYFIPASKASAVHLSIFNVLGEKVRGLDLGSPSANTYHYVAWDGRNDSGQQVASGVYVGELKVGSEKRFWKMAVIK